MTGFLIFLMPPNIISFGKSETGLPMAKVAASVMVGKTLKELGVTSEPVIKHMAVKEAVMPFDRFSGVDTILGPEMKSTGEVMGIDDGFGMAYAKAQAACKNIIPTEGKVIFSLRDEDKEASVSIARKMVEQGLKLVATRGTMEYFKKHGIESEFVYKVIEGERPHIVDAIKNREVAFVINTVGDAQSKKDSFSIRETALKYGVPYSTTIAGGKAVANAVKMLKTRPMSVKSIQEYHRES